MVNKGISIFLLTVFILFSSLIKAEVSATIDRSPVRVNETFELTLHMESAPVSRPPLKGLPDGFEIVRSTNFYQRSTINGTTEVQAGWRFILRALSEGVYTIPAFEIDGEKTQALQITVLPPVSSTNIGDKQDAIRLTATVDSDDVYVQQQILYTIRLYRAVQAQYASLSEPEMKDAILERLGEDKQYETEENGVRYIVLERRYVIFPQKNGKQTISSVTFTAEVSDGSRRYSTLGRLRSRTTAISLSTDAIDVNVKNRPDGILDWWLPANNVTLSEQWLPQPIEYRVGEPVTWVYSIEAEGLTGNQLPELLPASTSGIKFYPDAAQSDNRADNDGITGIRTQKIAVVPTRAGSITLPELKLSWWDVTKNQTQEINLPPRTIEVLPALETQNSSPEPIVTADKTTAAETTPAQTESTEGSEANLQQPLTTTAGSDEQQWKMLAIFSLLLWVISLLVFMLKRKSSTPAMVEQPAAVQTLADLDTVRRACKTHSAADTKDALLAWCANQPALGSVHSLAGLARQLDNASLAEQLQQLDKTLYSGTETEWNGDHLASLLKQLRASVVTQAADNKEGELPPLHLSDNDRL